MEMTLRPGLDVLVVVGELGLRGFLHLLFVLGDECRVHLHLRRSESGHGDELEVRVADELAGEVQEGFLEVVVRFGRDVVVLKKDRLTVALIFMVSIGQRKCNERLPGDSSSCGR